MIPSDYGYCYGLDWFKRPTYNEYNINAHTSKTLRTPYGWKEVQIIRAFQYMRRMWNVIMKLSNISNVCYRDRSSGTMRWVPLENVELCPTSCSK